MDENELKTICELSGIPFDKDAIQLAFNNYKDE